MVRDVGEPPATPPKETTMATYLNGFSDLQHLSGEPHKAKAFYQGLFGWKMTDREIPGQGPRIEIEPEQGPGGAFMRAREWEAPRWMVFIDVTDLRATLAKARELGGKVLQEPVHIPHEGTLAVVADPVGAVFKLWQPEVPQ
jgi:predicted enzyme related to lactoylglutathione lyase